MSLPFSVQRISPIRRIEKNKSGRHIRQRLLLRLTLVAVSASAALAGSPAANGFEDSAPHDKKTAVRSVRGPVSPKESLRLFEHHPDVRIELVACEPQVIDPVAIAFDEYGRLWVAEYSDYPNGPAEGEPFLSRIRILRDRDGDGFFETATVFADHLPFANGIAPWRGGVIVTRAGEVAWMIDDDGDDRMDRQETWFAGFAEQNPQLRANHPTFAYDNRVYVANGLRGGTVVARRKNWAEGAKPVSISGRDFRFDPLSGRYAAVSGNGQFGLTFDDFGNRFVCSNRNPCRHVVLENHYIGRNPFLAVTQVVHDVSPPAEHSRVFAISRTWTTSTLHAGQFTAACGVTIYRGDLLPAAFRGNSFTCEPTGNLVHRDVLSPQGATFTSHYGRPGAEFLASRNEWFRPVNLANGPDGALYVVDMYRAVIEHPQFMPDELKNRPDLRYGDDRGRLYRIVPRESSAPRRPAAIRLAEASVAELVRLLEHPNAWHRETAARLLYERQDRSARVLLERVATSGRTTPGRIHALWALDGLGGVSDAVLARALEDGDPRVREHALRLAEPRLAGRSDLLVRALKCASADDARLRFQAALSLGAAPYTAEVAAALAEIGLRGADDPWSRLAVATAVGDHPADVLELVLSRYEGSTTQQTQAVAELVGELAALVGSRQKDDEIARTVAALTALYRNGRTDADRMAVILVGFERLGVGVRRRGKSLLAFVEKLPEPHARRVRALFEQAARIAGDRSADIELRRQAVALLEYVGYEIAGETLKRLAREEPNQPLRVAAVDALARYTDPEIGPWLLDDFAAQTPPIRRAILRAMLRTVRRTGELLDAVEAKQIAVTELDPATVRLLSRHRDTEIRQRAARLLAEATPADRKKVLAEFTDALFGSKKLFAEADPERGRTVFEKNCATCHRVAGIGVDVAPDIADSRTRRPEQLLTDILDPNRAIDSNYFTYTVITQDGSVHTGIVAAETASSVTLRQAENKTVTVLRQEIEEMRSNGVSLMPVGLEKNITPEQMADLISFIKNWRYLEAKVPARAGASTETGAGR